MPTAYILYNPLAGGGKTNDVLDALAISIVDDVCFVDLTKAGALKDTIGLLRKDDYLILCGGDGTLNWFVNETAGVKIENEILYYPAGTGNDFTREYGQHNGAEPFAITQYIKDLPSVTVKGNTCRFLNGVGFGIDGYCCQEGDRLRRIPGKKVNYTMIAIQGLLTKYKPTGATVCVDGITHRFEKVWIAPTMYGIYYGGGMIPAPRQKRGADHLSLMVFHGSSKLRTLMIFPSIFKGTITKYSKYVSVFPGREITVAFDEPRPLQIDGETIENVTTYTARRFCGKEEAAC